MTVTIFVSTRHHGMHRFLFWGETALLFLLTTSLPFVALGKVFLTLFSNIKLTSLIVDAVTILFVRNVTAADNIGSDKNLELKYLK